jgi:hypothetical protein
VAFYALHGLIFDSDIALPAARWSAGESAPQGAVTVVLGERRPILTNADGDGELLAHSDRGYCIALKPKFYLMRFFGLCDFIVSEGAESDGRLGTTVVVHPAPETPLEFVSILLAGNVAALLLTLQGHWPLHASAVEYRGCGLAFAGASGMGKSTLASLLCANGARLITDDVLGLRERRGYFDCLPGTEELRLRPDALMARPADDARKSWDGRLVLRPPAPCRSPVPLHAVVVPLLQRHASKVLCERLSERQAVLTLSRYPRILGWQSRQLHQQFYALSALARAVAIWSAEIPRGIGSDRELAGELLSRLKWPSALEPSVAC